LITDESPFVLMRRELLRRTAWAGRAREAEALLALNRAAGVSQPVLLGDEARVRWAAGDRPGGLELARRALELDPSPENKRLVEELSRPAARVWSPELAHFDDDK